MGRKSLEVPFQLNKKIKAEQDKLSIPGIMRVNQAAVVLFWYEMWKEYQEKLTPEEIEEKRRNF